MKAKTLGSVTLCSAILFGTVRCWAKQSAPTAPAAPQTTDNDVAALKAQLAEQQKQIDALKSAIEEEKKLIEKAANARARKQPGQLCLAAQQGARRCGQHHADHSPGCARRGARGCTDSESGTSSRRRPATPATAPPDTERRAALFAVRQRLHYPGRVYGRDVRVARQERGIGYRKQFRQRSLQQHGQRKAFRNPLQPPELAALASASMETGRAPTSSAITSSTSWEPAAHST